MSSTKPTGMKSGPLANVMSTALKIMNTEATFKNRREYGAPRPARQAK